MRKSYFQPDKGTREKLEQDVDECLRGIHKAHVKDRAMASLLVLPTGLGKTGVMCLLPFVLPLTHSRCGKFPADRHRLPDLPSGSCHVTRAQRLLHACRAERDQPVALVLAFLCRRVLVVAPNLTIAGDAKEDKAKDLEVLMDGLVREFADEQASFFRRCACLVDMARRCLQAAQPDQ